MLQQPGSFAAAATALAQRFGFGERAEPIGEIGFEYQRLSDGHYQEGMSDGLLSEALVEPATVEEMLYSEVLLQAIITLVREIVNNFHENSSERAAGASPFPQRSCG